MAAVLAVLLTATGALTGWQPASAADCVVDDLLVNSCHPWLGASPNKYPQVAAGLRSQVEYHEQRIGRQLDIVHSYNVPTATGLSADQAYFATRPDTILLLNWKPAAVWADATGGDAAVNARIDSNAASIRALDAKILLNVYHEPENDVTGTVPGCSTAGTGTAGTPEQYRAMWRNVRERFDAAGVTNVVWVVNFMSQPTRMCMVDDLWPGNDLVDWVMFDNYGNGANADYVTNVSRMYDFLTATSDATHDYLAKPWGMAEWSINQRQNTTAAQQYAYFDQARAALESGRFPRLKALVVYDSVGPDGNENRIAYNNGGYDPVKQDHYLDYAHSPAFFAPLPPDTDPPTAPSALTATVTAAGVVLTWQPGTDDRGVDHHLVFRDGDLIGAPTATTWTDSGVPVGATHSYTVAAVDVAGNVGPSTDPATVTVPDLVAPSTPSPTAIRELDDSVQLTWPASTDNVAVTGYQVWRDATLLATVATPGWRDGPLGQGRSYRYDVQAVDAAGNRSGAGTVTVTVPDLLAPSAPGSVSAISVTRRTASVTWTAAIDNVAVTGYRIYRDTTLIATVAATVRSYQVTGLSSGRYYTFSVRAVDGAGLAGPAGSSRIKIR